MGMTMAEGALGGMIVTVLACEGGCSVLYS